MVLQHVDYDEDEVEVALKLVKEKRLRGIIFLGGYLVHSEEKLAQLHVPFILSTTGMLPKGFSRNTYSSVAVDDTKESYKMVDYLCKNGHKDIAILCARKTDASIGKLRLEGYKKALKDNGIEVREELILPMRSDLEDYSLENGYMVTKESPICWRSVLGKPCLMPDTRCRRIFLWQALMVWKSGNMLSRP